MPDSPGLGPAVVDAALSFATPSSSPQLPSFEQSSWGLQQQPIVLALVVFLPPDDAIVLGVWTPPAGRLSFDQFQLSDLAFVVLLSHPVKNISAFAMSGISACAYLFFLPLRCNQRLRRLHRAIDRALQGVL